MPSKSKIKGNNYERELVNQAKEYELNAKRSWGSDGRSMGMHEEVDLIVEAWSIQAKRRKSIAKWILPNENVDAQCVRGDNGKSFIIMRYDDWCAEMSHMKELMRDIARLTKAQGLDN